MNSGRGEDNPSANGGPLLHQSGKNQPVLLTGEGTERK